MTHVWIDGGLLDAEDRHLSAFDRGFQRGDGVFERSIQGLQMLNKLGYGQPGSDLQLNLVYNPQGAGLPPPQEASMAQPMMNARLREASMVRPSSGAATNSPPLATG